MLFTCGYIVVFEVLQKTESGIINQLGKTLLAGLRLADTGRALLTRKKLILFIVYTNTYNTSYSIIYGRDEVIIAASADYITIHPSIFQLYTSYLYEYISAGPVGHKLDDFHYYIRIYFRKLFFLPKRLNNNIIL